MKQLRIDFPDYTAEQQEADSAQFRSKHARPKDIYVMRVNGEWGAVLPRPKHNVIFNADYGVDLVEFITNVKADLQAIGLNPRFHCVQNFGIESKIAEHQKDKRIIKEWRDDNRGY